MNYTGVIIEESLDDTSVLKQITITDTKIEPITPEHKTPWLSQWTLYSVEIPEEAAQAIAEKISHSFDKNHPVWYADFKNAAYHYIIFANKVFRVDQTNPILYKVATTHGLSIGIPSHQLDFTPKDEE